MHADLQSIVEAAKKDAATPSGLSPGAIKVLVAERVTWSDGSLGCPQPDRVYTQALVPGYRVLVRAGEQLLDYHASQRGEPRLCPPDHAQDPLPGATRM